MKKLVVATKNKNKIKEIMDIMKNTGIKIVSLYDLGIEIDVKEDGTTFEENAYKKAYEIMKITHMPTMADDSGLEVDALGGAPGVYSARFAGVHGDDRKNNEKLLILLKDVPNNLRKARFVCVIALVYPDGEKKFVRGEIEGTIARSPSGNSGFGYDPLFIVPEYNKTFAQLGSNIKNKISHRGKALRALKEILSNSSLSK